MAFVVNRKRSQRSNSQSDLDYLESALGEMGARHEIYDYVPGQTAQLDHSSLDANSLPLRLLLITVVSIFVAEALVMILLDWISPIPPWTEVFLDALLIALATLPVLYLWMFRPLSQSMKSNYMVLRQLRASEHRYQRIAEWIAEGIWILDKNLKTVYVNTRLAELIGYSPDELQGMSLEQLVPIQLSVPSKADSPSVSKEYESCSTSIRRRNGSDLMVTLSIRTVFNSKNQFSGWVMIVTDVSEQKRAEHLLNEMVEGLATKTGPEIFETLAIKLADLMNAKYVIIGRVVAGETERISSVAMTINGQIVDNITYGLANTPYENAINQGMCFYESGIQEKFPKDEDLKRMGAQSYLGIPLVSSRGKSLGLIAILNDEPMGEVSGNINRAILHIFANRAAAELERIETVLTLEAQARVLDEVQDAVISTDTGGIILHWNKGAERMFGFAASEAVGANISIIYPDNVVETITKDVVGKLQEKGGVTQEHRLRKKSGEEFFGRISLTLQIDNQRNPSKVISIISDITKKKQSELALKESEQLYRSIFEKAAQMILSVDPSGRILDCNQRVKQILGYEPSEVIGQRLIKYLAHGSRPEMIKVLGEIKETEISLHREFKVISKDGRIIEVNVDTTALNDSEGQMVRSISIIDDITAKKAQEQSLVRTEKLKSVGLLAGGIAHDFNNLLAGVLGNVSLVRSSMDSESEEYNCLYEAEKAAVRAGELTQQLLTFSRGGEPIKEHISISQIIRDSVSFVLSGSNVSFNLDLDESLPDVVVDPSQFSHVLQNLIINADQAMPDGGQIDIVANLIELKDNEVPPLRAGSYVRLSVTDHGIGIPKKDIDRVFDPYFTTKSTGSGLGLATCYAILERHNGRIEIDSAPGRGTTIKVYVPAADTEIVAEEELDQAPLHCTARVLVMDDQDYLRRLVSRVLESIGCTVDRAENGYQAVEMFKKGIKDAKPYDCVILDLTIPGSMGGKLAVNELKALDASVKAIACSGYADDSIMADCQSHNFDAVVAKPFKPKALVQTVCHLLANNCPQNIHS